MKNLQKTAKKFIKKLKGTVTFDSVAEYLQSEGYAIIYYSSPECQALTEEYEMVNYIRSVNAFTYCCDSVKLVFINDKIPLNEMLCSILHESAHIFLGHMTTNPYATDERRNEMEAEAFACAVLTYKKSFIPYLTVILVFLLSFAALFCVLSNPAPKTNTEDAELVYITPTGRRYHRESCIYIKNKDCTAITKTQAQKSLSPCSVCNP